jgi:hypothetical protein
MLSVDTDQSFPRKREPMLNRSTSSVWIPASPGMTTFIPTLNADIALFLFPAIGGETCGRGPHLVRLKFDPVTSPPPAH